MQKYSPQIAANWRSSFSKLPTTVQKVFIFAMISDFQKQNIVLLDLAKKICSSVYVK